MVANPFRHDRSSKRRRRETFGIPDVADAGIELDLLAGREVSCYRAKLAGDPLLDCATSAGKRGLEQSDEVGVHGEPALGTHDDGSECGDRRLVPTACGEST